MAVVGCDLQVRYFQAQLFTVPRCPWPTTTGRAIRLVEVGIMMRPACEAYKQCNSAPEKKKGESPSLPSPLESRRRRDGRPDVRVRAVFLSELRAYFGELRLCSAHFFC